MCTSSLLCQMWVKVAGRLVVVPTAVVMQTRRRRRLAQVFLGNPAENTRNPPAPLPLPQTPGGSDAVFCVSSSSAARSSVRSRGGAEHPGTRLACATPALRQRVPVCRVCLGSSEVGFGVWWEDSFVRFILLFLREAQALCVFMCLSAGVCLPAPPAIQFEWDHFRHI